MNCFKLIERNNKDLHKINGSFLWTPNIGPKEDKEILLVAYDEVCRPKAKGGLGIRRNEDVNKASFIKLGRRVLTDNDSILTRIIRDKHVNVTP